MKDIDFDELDRAVSSVLGEKTPKQGESDTTNVSVPSATHGASSSVTPAPSDPAVDDGAKAKEPTAVSSEAEKPKPTSRGMSLASKRRGKFMDVMHPSGEMSASRKIPANPVHIAPIVEPLLPAHAETTDAEEPRVEHPAEPTASLDESHTPVGAEPASVDNDTAPSLPETIATPTPDTVPAGAFDRLVDGIIDTDVSPKEKDETSVDPVGVVDKETDGTVAVAETTISTDDDETESAAESSFGSSMPQASPFLADTKVDKRPLGGAGVDADATNPQNTPLDTQTAPQIPLPRELQPDVVGVESGSEETTAPVVSGSAFSAKTETAPGGADDGRVEGHPLFDASTYHEPIAVVHGKRTPSWIKWMIGLAVCLAVGAGVGYLLFTAGL